MGTNLTYVHAHRAAFIAAALLVTATVASAASYEFKVIGAPADGDIQTIVLVDSSTGQAVPGADIYVVHTVYLPHRKGAPNIQRIFVPLQDHLNGKCTHSQSESPTSRELTVMAKIPGAFWPVWGTIDLCD